MTRAAATGAGLRGPGQVVWPEQIKEFGRHLALSDEAQILVYVDDDEAPAKAWTPTGPTYRCRVDPVGHDITEERAQRMEETTTHMISLDPGAPVTTDNRLRINDEDWVLLAVRRYTDAEILRVESKLA